MSDINDRNNTGLGIGSRIHGYLVKRIEKLNQADSDFYELVHEGTGASHIHISRDDKENVFSVAFKTVPRDSTGVAHILEHTVLCGSKKFPIRDPFFSMLKRSLSTFMNAFTSSDWTMYPFSTQNRNDYNNLMDVYLDSVFYPELKELSFKQEGCRIEVEGNSGKAQFSGKDNFRLTYKGVVYNEMKGAMSSPSEVMVRKLQKTLYPLTTYGYNSGGDPAVIPMLTYGQLKAFHQKHYHPSNAFFFTYGNFPLKDHLSFINERILEYYDRIDPATKVSPQPRWHEPQKVNDTYPFDEKEDPSGKCQVCVAWLAADITESYEVLCLKILERILLGNPASPLRKALIESELGSSLCDGAGYDADNRDTLFAAGLKDTQASAASKIEKVIFDVLTELAQEGIDRSYIESAIHQIEFRRKEITNVPYPYGIKLLMTFAGSWFHGGDPLNVLNFDKDLKRLRSELETERPLEKRIQGYFLDNPHRVLFSLLPDQQMAKKEAERIRSEIAAVKSKLSMTDLKKIVEDAETLKQLQEEKEDISCLPTLELEEISPEVVCVKASDAYPEVPAVCYDQETSGIYYFSGVAGSASLPEEWIKLVPFFCYAVTKVGTDLRDYTKLTQLIDRYTGGISLAAHAGDRFNHSDCVSFIGVNGKSLARNQKQMLKIVQELLCDYSFSDLARLKSLLLEYRAGLESRIITNGHRLAILLASRNFSTSCRLKEIWNGIHLFVTVKALTEELSPDRLQEISDELQCIGDVLFNRDNIKIAIVGDEAMLSASTEPITILHETLRERALKTSGPHSKKAGFDTPDIRVHQEIPREGWSTTSEVSFVAQAFQTVKLGHEDAPALAVISKMLRSIFLHREIREKGGAYGGFALYNTEDGIFSFGSYRDPHIVATLKTYRDANDFVTSGNYTDEDIKEAILQVCSDIDKPDPPAIAARNAFYRTLVDLSDDVRREFKERLLALTRNQVTNIAGKYFSGDNWNQGIAVISNEKKLKAANEKLKEDRLTLHKI